MKKLIFNEGGQPVYLDDLQTIQEEIKVGTNIGSSFLTSNQRGYAVGRALIANESLSSTTYLVQAHRIVVDDEVYDIDAMTTAVSDLSSLYYHIRTTPEDARRTADGQTKACSALRTGFISTNGSEDGVNGIAFDLVPNLPAAVRKAIGINEWEDVTGITLQNGFQGAVQMKRCDGYTKVRIRLNGYWATDWSRGYDVFYWTNECPLYSLLCRKTTPSQGLCGDDVLSDRGYLNFHDSGCSIEFERTPNYPPTSCFLDFVFDVNG